MNINTNLRISIPKPCHEDWNKFTPDEKGAFCKVCSKSVHDFTKKSPEEISTILVQEISAGNKVCGRFNEDQLDKTSPPEPVTEISGLNLDPYSLNFKRLKKFALALFVVFGGFLFGAVKSSAQKMGKVAYVPRPAPVKGEMVVRQPEQQKDTARVVEAIKVIQPTKCDPVRMLGDVSVDFEKVDPVVKTTTQPGVKVTEVDVKEVLGQTVIREEVMEMGAVELMEEPVLEDTLAIQPVNVIEPVAVDEEPLIMGLIIMPEQDGQVVTDPILADPMTEVDIEEVVPESTFVEMDEEYPEITSELLKNDNSPIVKAESSLKCYPNPSAGPINIKYTVNENNITTIALYDLKGNLVKTVLNPQKMYAADYATQFDISDLQDGVYVCKLQCGDKVSTQRIVLGR